MDRAAQAPAREVERLPGEFDMLRLPNGAKARSRHVGVKVPLAEVADLFE